VRRRGFSLFEMIIATAILAGAAVLLLELADLGWRHASAAEQGATAQRICQNLLNEYVAGAQPLLPGDDLPVPGEDGWVYSATLERVAAPLRGPGLALLRLSVREDLPGDGPRVEFTLARWVRPPQRAVGAEGYEFDGWDDLWGEDTLDEWSWP
jgi:prepilin-type N-terminal cleavage/methylation domain-containing protein